MSLKEEKERKKRSRKKRGVWKEKRKGQGKKAEKRTPTAFWTNRTVV